MHTKALMLKITVTWFCTFLLLGFLLSTRATASPVTLSVIPEVPKTGEPIVATFTIKNQTDTQSDIGYQLFINGEATESGNTVINPRSSSQYQYAYVNPLPRGEQVNFVLKTESDNGNLDKIVSMPAYPPQLMSSFVSFAAFSTSVMSSMMSMEYFNNTFGTTGALNTGIIISLILIGLLIFLELSQAIIADKGFIILSRYRINLSNVTIVLFIIFVGMVFTRLFMTLAT